MVYNAANGGSQTVARESDVVIVPEITGNAGGGKDDTQVRPLSEGNIFYTQG